MVDILKGMQFYRMFIALVLYVRELGCQGARNMTGDADNVENSALPTPKFGDRSLIFECQFVGRPNIYNTQEV